MNKLNAQRRLNNLDPDEIEEANNTKDEVLDRYIDNKEMKGPNVDEVDYDNKTSVSPGLIRKKIRKGKSKKSTATALSIALKTRDKIKKKLDREVFNGENEREKRKQKRKNRENFNKVKARNQSLSKKKKK